MARVAVLGSAALLDACAPASVPGLIEVVDSAADADAVVAFDPDDELAAAVAGSGVPALLWRESAGPQPAAQAQRQVLSSGDAPGAWRCVSLPVADRLFADAHAELPVRAGWLGPPTPRRAYYTDLFDHTDALASEGEPALVAVNIHEEEAPSFEPRAVRALAAGRLLVSETLVPARGLEPGIDYLAAEDFDDLYLAVEAALAQPNAFRRVRLRGRRKAELFRASRVIARLVGDLLAELRSSGARSASS